MACRAGAGFRLGRGTRLYRARAPVPLLRDFRRHFALLFGLEPELTANKTAGRLELEEHRDSLPPEGYTLAVSDGHGDSVLVIGVAAATRRASLLHALQSLRQLLPPAVFGRSPEQMWPLQVPHCVIRDWPRYRWRGLMLDVARHFFGVGRVKELLLLMSAHKLNVLHLHLSDDQGWRVEVSSRPELASVGGTRGSSLNRPEGDENGERIYTGASYGTPRFFSKAEVRELVAFAAELEIEVVPEIDMPAHAAALIVAARSVGRDLGTVELHEGCAEQQGSAPLLAPPNCLGGTHGIVTPTKDALEYVLGAIAEVAELFPSRHFHLGGDEADEFRDSAYASEVAEALMRELGISSSAALQGYMVNKTHQLLRAHGKTVIAWDETHFGLEEYKPPPDVLAMWWRDWSPEAPWEEVQKLGRRLILAPSSKMYLDVYQVEPHAASRHRVQEGTVSLWDTYSAAQLEGPGILGVHACLWSEHLKSREVLQYQLFPRGAAVAEVAWTPKARASDFGDFLQRWRTHKDRLESLGVSYFNGTYTGAPEGNAAPPPAELSPFLA